MKPDRDDPIIDPLLEEVLGQQQPPDLTARILQALARREKGEPAATPATSHYVPQGRGRNRRRMQEWLQFAASLGVAGALLGMAWLGFAWQKAGIDNSNSNQIAQHQPQNNPPAKSPANIISQVIDPTAPSSPQIAAGKQIAAENPPGSSSGGESKTEPATQIARQDSSVPVTPAVAPKQSEPDQTRMPADEMIAEGKTEPKSASDLKAIRNEDTRVVSYVNAQLAGSWREHRISPAALASDDQWCRRVYLRIIGRIPSVDELRKFAADRSSDKRDRLVQRLVYDDAYAAEFARHWSDVWANVLIGRGVGTESREQVSRAGLEQYLQFAFSTDRPFDEIAHDLLTATGSGRPGEDPKAGAANFLLAAADEQGIAATDRTCRIFLGVNLQCARCHDHPSASWKQSDFWSLNAFFRQLRVRHTDRNDPAQLFDFDYLGDDGRDPQGLVFYEAPNGLVKAAEPRFLDGLQPAVATSGYVADVNRREELSQFITASPLFGQAIVNRMWAQFHGYGFTRPLDDVGSSNAPSHPEILDQLAIVFRTTGYDFKRLLTWIALSDSFQRASSPPSTNLVDSPAQGTRPLFSYYYARPMAGEEVIRSLQIAAKLRRENGTQGTLAQARVDWLAQYQRSLPREEAAESGLKIVDAPADSGIIPGGLMKHATTAGYDGLLQSVLHAKLPFREKVEHLFLAALSRQPTKAELAAAGKIAGPDGSRESEALEDIWWALLNSSEFLLDR